MALTISSALSQILGDNGMVDVGLGAGTDHRNANARCLPVPRNVLAGTVHATRMRVAMWAYNKMVANLGGAAITDEDRQLALGAYVIWSLGWTATMRTAEVDDNTPAPTAIAEVNALGWDGDVHVYDEDVPNFNTLIDATMATALTPPGLDKAAFSNIATIILASKITWWQTRHHLGPTLATAAGGRNRFGYLEKTTMALNVRGLTLDGGAGEGRVHDLCHMASTVQVMRYLAVSNKLVSTIKECYRQPVIHTGGGTMVISNAIRLNCGEDVKIRASGFGAGMRPIEDTAAGLRLIFGSGIAPWMPGRAMWSQFIEAVDMVKKDPFSYGISAPYLAKHAKTFNRDPFEPLISAVRVYVRANHRGSTLSKAAVFQVDSASDTYHNAPWAATCMQYQLSSAKTVTSIQDMVMTMRAQFGSAGGTSVSKVEEDAITAFCGLSYTAQWNAGIQAVKDLGLIETDATSSSSGPTGSAKSKSGTSV